MVDVSRIIGLSRNAFSILATAYGLEKIIFFEEEITGDHVGRSDAGKEGMRQEYAKTLFKMKQQNLILAKGDCLQATEPVREIFQILSNAYRMITVQGRSRESTDLCLYVGKKEDMVILRKGSRKDEYIKLEKRNKSDMGQVLDDGGHIPPCILKEKKEKMPSQSIEMQIRARLMGLKPKGYDLFQEMEEAETWIRVFDGVGNREKMSLAILHYPMEDVIVFGQSQKMEIMTFHKTNMMDCLKKMF